MKTKLFVSSAMLLAVLVSGNAQASSRKSADEGQLVDSGSFGIFLNGKRVGTETFTIQQKPDGSIATSELKIEDGTNKASQSSELQIASNGDLRKYQWRELGPGKGQTTVEHSDQFLVEHVIPVPGEKAVELAFMLPPSTMILDDNFFTHRQILLWRYLAAGCGGTPTQKQCKLERWQFGVFVPRQQSSATVAVEYKGKEKVTVHGTERELDRFSLQSEGIDWSLWLDSNYKVVRILVPSENVEVVRD